MKILGWILGFLFVATAATALYALTATEPSLAALRYQLEKRTFPGGALSWTAARGRLWDNLLLEGVALDIPATKWPKFGAFRLTAERARVRVRPGRPVEWELDNARWQTVGIRHLAVRGSQWAAEDVHIDASGILGEGAEIEIQNVTARQPFKADGPWKVDNGRLRLAKSDTALFYGSQDQGKLGWHFFSKALVLQDLWAAWNPSKTPPARGDLLNLDLAVAGTLKKPRLQGSFDAGTIQRRGLTWKQSAVRFDVESAFAGKQLTLEGTARIEGGSFKRGPVAMDIFRGHLVFEGDPENPRVDLEAGTTVEQTRITLRLRGTILKPDLALSSDPSQTQEGILLMLATGREWKGMEQSFQEKRISTDLAAEFVDYALLGGAGQGLARRWGIRDVSLLYDETSQGVGIKKALGDKLDLGVGFRQERPVDGAVAARSQTVGVDYKVSPDTVVSVEGEAELAAGQDSSLDAAEEDPAQNRSVTMKIKKNF